METAVKRFDTENYKVAVCVFANVDFSQVEAVLNTEEQAKYHTLSEKRKREFAASRILLHSLLDKEYEAMYYTVEGKPQLRNYFVSISHSNNYCAVLLSKTAECGIDIEEYRPKIAQLAPRFMSETEVAKFTTLEEQTLVWCAKEALFKCTNAGVDFRENYCVHTIEGNAEHGEICAEVNHETCRFFQKLSYFRSSEFFVVLTTNQLRKF
ncbi:MAG: 4'-phosphopantetheinyl transferase superfamily protein [Bacteroidales bacterium]|jgi:phosphopantetheinyl transferase|nr:4'-phosphopantetheinyl transferase superfamily protein [Bacteroidales bacterium]